MTRTGAYNAMRSEEYVDGSVWKPQASHFYFYFVGKCDVLARGLHGSSNLYYDKSHIVRLGSSSIKREPI